MARFDQNIGMRRDEAGTLIADLRAQIAGQTEEVAQITATVVQAAVVDGTFTLTYTATKKDKFVQLTLRFADFGAAYDLKIVLVRASEIANSDDYANKRFPSAINDKIDDTGRSTQLWTTRLAEFLEWNTLYYIISIVSIGQDRSDRAFNPTPDSVYAGFPGNAVYSFTTPLEPGVIQAGGPNLINGGGMMHSEEQYTVLEGGASVPAEMDYLGRRWAPFYGEATRIDRLAGGTLVSHGVRWLDTGAMLQHVYNMLGASGQPSTLIKKRLIGGETYTFSCLTSASAAIDDIKIGVYLADEMNGFMVGQETPREWIFPVMPEWKLLVAILRIPSSYVMSSKQWISIYQASDSSFTGENWYTTKWKLERGENVSPWVAHQQEDLLDAQSDITAPQGHGAFGQTTGGIYDRAGTKFGGPDGFLIGEFKR